MSGLKLPKFKSMSINKTLVEYTNPDKVYIPLISSKDTDIEPLVKKGDHVKKGQVLGRRTGNFKTPICSSLSGKVIGFEEITHYSGIPINSIVIENDFTGNITYLNEARENINKIEREEFLKIIEESGIVGMSGSGFPAYAKYNTDSKINTLLINAVECEPYITADYTIIKTKFEEILEVIDAILEINNIDNAIIVVSEKNTTAIDIIKKYIGTYLNIKCALVPDIYPMGWERKLIKEVLKISYDKIPIEKGIIVSNIATINAIGEALKFNKPLIERIVTFSGDGVNEPCNILVSIGTRIDEIIDFINGNEKKSVFIANGPMMGSIVDKNLVITPDINMILSLPNIEKGRLKECLRCGKCDAACPSHISPVLIKDHVEVNEDTSSFHPELCVECGLCTFTCPSKIEVRDFVKKAKALLRENAK